MSHQECVLATPTKAQPTQQVGYRLVWTASSPRLTKHAKTLNRWPMFLVGVSKRTQDKIYFGLIWSSKLQENNRKNTLVGQIGTPQGAWEWLQAWMKSFSDSNIWVRKYLFLKSYVTSEGVISNNVLKYQQLSVARYHSSFYARLKFSIITKLVRWGASKGRVYLW